MTHQRYLFRVTLMFSAESLHGERISLRCLERRDAFALLALYADPDVMRFWSHPPWATIDQANLAISEAQADYLAGASLHYVIEHSSTGALIGSCALFAFVPHNRRATLGYLLAKPFWGQGYLSEAMRLLFDYAFAELDLNRIEADVNPSNTGSARVLERLGFRHEGRMRERWIVSGEKHDTDAYSLLSSDWCADAPAPLRVSLPVSR
jgi:ribosomal-protein-alanine N-acetyltransferase